MQRLNDTPRPLDRRTLVTGAGGYVGTLTAAALLAGGVPAVLVPLRDPSRKDEVRSALALELLALGADPHLQERIEWLDWPEIDDMNVAMLAALMRDRRVEEVVHCAGCIDYYDERALQQVNVDYTRMLGEAALAVGVARFVYISTAYAGGYREGQIREALLDEPPSDPTPYTCSKRRAEHVIAGVGVPWLILRPSVLIGDARRGRYSGKRYGLYQQWMGLERLMCGKYHADIHTVAPEAPLNLLHQDAWQASFLACLKHVPDASVVNVVSEASSCPSMRQLWQMWVAVVRPQRVHFYPRFEDVDLRAIDLRQRAYLSFAQINLEIGAHVWSFQRGWMHALESAGHLAFDHATVDSVQQCQDRFVAASDILREFSRRHADSLAVMSQFIEVRSDENAVSNQSLSVR
ncbi:NAD-dependent epimerase/dehydratase family protein [Denitromonas iodatirespirans]|uniref:NAD-dependent epimerase/dehydratase family protein n=1 Tax=Denitromonas iodatirespirans TaxID=2795389 RepID=A0A944D922_DENI1|nr:NAD-dependent epimerase/dehydratase family protein [Denitromonas iodatirespirans]MBT0962400.1 NAD-dependent epimerase/dehydratase family protein [Denitromonas iodatirespirans]